MCIIGQNLLIELLDMNDMRLYASLLFILFYFLIPFRCSQIYSCVPTFCMVIVNSIHFSFDILDATLFTFVQK